MKIHHKESLLGLPDFVGLLMDGLCNTGAVGDIRIPHSGVLEQEQVLEGCTVHKWKGLVSVEVTHESNFKYSMLHGSTSLSDLVIHHHQLNDVLH